MSTHTLTLHSGTQVEGYHTGVVTFSMDLLGLVRRSAVLP
jgi:hypothetical protein